MRFRRSRKAGTVNEALLFRLGSELEAKFSRTEATGHSFIYPEDAKDVLRREHMRELFGSLSWYEEDHRTDVWQHMRLILCILISMRWREWDAFQTYFFLPGRGLQYPRYTDVDLPIPREHFIERVPPDFLEQFYEHQYRFIPIFINENSHGTYSANCRLPILRIEPLRDVDSSQGVVEKVLVEKRYLLYENGSSNDAPRVMAYKRITAKTEAGQLNFGTEQRTLTSFKECLTNNANIMQSFASFIHGANFVILSPWADGRDLHMFLTRPDEILDSYMSRSFRFSPDNLLTEAYNLAGALDFLHNRLVSPRGKKLRCAHLDLKPENVLVTFPPESRANEAPVGRWKISDFGLSKVEEAVTEGRVIPIAEHDQTASMAPGNIARDLSIQPPTRGAGAFQPPEVQNTGPVKVSTRRDVWSYGCILAMVLAFALKGPEEVKEQTRRRDTSGADDFFYRRTHRHSRPPGPNQQAFFMVDAEIKPPIRRWLEQAHKLAVEPHEQWIKYTSRLIFELLEVNVTSRPEIKVAVDTLNRILASTEHLAAHRLWDFDDSSTMLEAVVIPPPEPPSQPQDNSSPFIGTADHSPTSSVSNTAPSPRSPRRDSHRSSGGSTSIFSQDSTRSFARLVAPPRCLGAAIEASGQAAALWSAQDVKIYNLDPLHGDAGVWSNRPTHTHTELGGMSMGPIYLPNSSQCRKVQLAGQWLAMLEQLPHSTYCIRLYHRNEPQQATYQFQSKYSTPEAPQDFKLSSIGTLAIRFRDRIDLRAPGGTAQVPLVKDFAGMAFTRSGEYFCLWECDRREKGQNTAAYNYWTVWSQGSSSATEFKILGDMIHMPIPPYVPEKSSGAVFLAAFSSYPRFIACDRQQHVYSVRADLQTGRVHLLGKSDNVAAGFVLPDDESFMLIRGSPHERQRAERCFMSFMPEPSLQIRPFGKLYENFVPETDGAAVVADDNGDSPYLMTLKPSGILGRKML